MLEVATLLTTSFIESENRMKHPEHTTSEQVGPTLRQISRWHEELRELHARLRPHFARPEVHQQALRYLQAVLSDVPRKNGWQLAEQARQAHPYGMQRLLSQAVWDQEAVRDEVRRLVSETLRSPRPQEADEAPFPVLVLDESGFPKRGRHSAGVGPQDCGRTWRVENWQVGGLLSYVTASGHCIEVVCVQTRAGLLLTDVASIAQQAFRARDWQRLSQSLGTKGERLFDWARLPIVHAGVADGRHWLVVRRCLDDPHELAYYLVWAPPQTPLPPLVAVIRAPR